MDHKISQINLETMRGICSVCGEIDIKSKKVTGKYRRYVCGNKIRKDKRDYWKSPAGIAARKRNGKGDAWPYRKYVKPTCERCGDTPIRIELMDGHHKDGDRKNNSPENIESLCCGCHRLVHMGLEHLIVPAVHKVDEVVREPVFDEQKDREIADLKRKLDISCKEYDKLEVKIKVLEGEAAIFEKRREAWMAADESAKVRWAINERNQVIALLKKSRSQYDQEVS